MGRILAFSAVFAISAFLFGCSQSSGPADTAQRVTPSSQTSASVFDIPCPNISLTCVVGTSGHDVTIAIDPNAQSNAYYTTQVWYAQGTSAALYGAVPTAALNPIKIYNYWGGSQKTIVQSPAYSGHYEIQRSTDGGTTWTNLPDYTGNSYVDAGLPDGSYTYRVKAKSRENRGTTTMTHHSNYCANTTITILTCTDSYSLSVGYNADGNNPGNMNWDDATHISTNANGNEWNTHFGLLSVDDNSCNGISSTEVTDGTSLYYSFDGGTWQQVPFNGGHYQLDGNNKLDNPTHGDPGTWYLLIATDAAGTNVIANIAVTSN
jgi:hypothetical protein